MTLTVGGPNATELRQDALLAIDWVRDIAVMDAPTDDVLVAFGVDTHIEYGDWLHHFEKPMQRQIIEALEYVHAA